MSLGSARFGFLFLAVSLVGCGSGGQGEAGGSGGSGGSGATGGGADLCAEVTCDDGDACTVDTCDPSDGSCIHEDALTNACRTQIEVDFPPRGATIQGDGADATVLVSGTVRSELGDIASLVLNGSPVSVGADGTFTQAVDARVGGNTLVLTAEDSDGNARTRVQSFLWSTGYLQPTAPKEGIASNGLGLWLGQSVLDDGQTPPPTDFAHILDLVLEGFDTSNLVPSNTAVVSQSGYDIYVTAIRRGGSTVKLDAIDGGLALEGRISNINGDLEFDCTEVGCFFAGGDSSGDFSLSSVLIKADVILGVTADNRLSVTLRNVSTTASNLDISSDNGWTNFLISLIEGSIRSAVVGQIEALLSSTVTAELGPLLEQGLSQLALEFSLEIPRLGEGEPITVDLITDFESTSFQQSAPKGGVLIERGGAYSAAEVATPYENLGVPNRDRCGAGGQVMTLPRSAALEIGLSDDLLNQVFYAAWRAGWLEIEGGPELLGGMDLSALGVANLQLTLSGLLAPTVSDCNAEGALRVHVGDLRILGSLSLNGEAVSFTAYSSLAGALAFGVESDGLGIGLEGIDQIDTEITIQEDSQIESEALLLGLLETALVNAIEGALGNGGLGTVPLPEIDLSSGVGLPAGSAVIEVMPQDVQRGDGVTVIGASL